MSEADPIDSDDRDVLKREILRIRDQSLGDATRVEILEDRVVELEQQVDALAAHNDELAAEIDRSPAMRVARAVGRRIKPR